MKEKYIIIDHFTNKQLGPVFDSEFDANHARRMHLQACLRDKVIHNNLLIIQRIK